MSRRNIPFKERILNIIESKWTKVGVYSAIAGAGYWFGTYRQENICIRNEAKTISDNNEKFYQLQQENLKIQNECNSLKLEVKELTYQLKNGK